MTNLVTTLKEHFKSHGKDLGVPNQKWETWKYAPLKKLNENVFGPLKNSVQREDIIGQEYFKNSGVLNFTNGEFLKSHNLNKGINISPIEDVSEEKLKPFVDFTNIKNFSNPHYYEALDKGKTYLIEIETKTNLTAPIIVNNSFTESSLGFETVLNIFILVGSQAKANFLEINNLPKTEDKSQLINLSKTIIINSGAKSTYAEELGSSSNDFFYNHTHTQVKRDATFNHLNTSFGGEYYREDLRIELSESGAHCGSYGISLLSDKVLSHHHTVIDHAAAHTTSEQLYKGIYRDASHGVFDGQVIVRKDSQQVNSSQLNKNLVIGEKARIDSKPQLVIDADDVKCAHGSTTGQLEEDALFYLQARGISANKGRSLLAKAFVSEVLDFMNEEDDLSEMRNFFSNRIENEFNRTKSEQGI